MSLMIEETKIDEIPEEYLEKPNLPLSLIIIMGAIIIVVAIILLLYKTGKLP